MVAYAFYLVLITQTGPVVLPVPYQDRVACEAVGRRANQNDKVKSFFCVNADPPE